MTTATKTGPPPLDVEALGGTPEQSRARYHLELARLAPERILGAAFTGPMFAYTPSHLWLMRSKLVWWALSTSAISPQFYRWWGCNPPRALRALARNVDCPVLVVSGEHDKITPPSDGLEAGSGVPPPVRADAGKVPHALAA